ncbi:probable homospermidine synthase protein, partial [Oceanicola granulosus HTCC2516]
MTETHGKYGRIDGPVVMIGFGSIGQGTLPLILRHFDLDPGALPVVEPSTAKAEALAAQGIRHVAEAVTRESYRELLGGLLEPGRGFCVNLSVDTSSLDLIRFCREIDVP